MDSTKDQIAQREVCTTATAMEAKTVTKRNGEMQVLESAKLKRRLERLIEGLCEGQIEVQLVVDKTMGYTQNGRYIPLD
jgi:hypothetical protein